MGEESGGMRVEPDVVLPVQFLPGSTESPEKRLLLAVLEEAVGTYQRYIMATDRRSRAVLADVEAWFASEDAVWLYSFVGVCDAIGLDPTYVRSGLARWAAHIGEHSRCPTPLPLPVPTRERVRHQANGRAPGLRDKPDGMRPACVIAPVVVVANWSARWG
jgi:hypothetical protein